MRAKYLLAAPIAVAVLTTALAATALADDISGTSGWLAQWLELVQDPDQKIARPKQIYTGERKLDFVPASQRWA